MFRYFNRITAAICAAVIIVGLGLSCCDDDNPVKPPPDDKLYPLYFTVDDPNIPNDDICFQYYPANGSIDSFPLPVTPNRHMSISADGKRIWISTYDTIYVFDIETESVVAELTITSGWTKAIFSPDNQLAAISGDGIYFINVYDYTIAFHDSAAGGNLRGQFSVDGRRYYCAIAGGYAYRVDLDRREGDTLYYVENMGAVEKILPSLDESRLFIITRLDMYTSGFFVYDISLDSIIYSQAFAPQPARIKTSPCGNYVYLTAGGTLNSVDIPPFSFAIFDVHANRFIEEVKIAFSDFPGPYFPLDYFAVTPDNRYLMGRSFWDYRYIAVYDLLVQDTVSIFRLGDKYAGHVECQIGL